MPTDWLRAATAVGGETGVLAALLPERATDDVAVLLFRVGATATTDPA